MVQKIITLLMLGVLTAGTLSACQSMGRAAGQTAEKVEEGADDFKKGYEDGKDN